MTDTTGAKPTVLEFAHGCMWEGGPWFIAIDHECSSYGGSMCSHCHSHRTVEHRRRDGSVYTTEAWTCPRVVIANNECGHNSTGVCLDCILEAAASLPERTKP